MRKLIITITIKKWSQKKSNATTPELFSGSNQAIWWKKSARSARKKPTHLKIWNGYFGHFRAYAKNSYMFIFASLEPKQFILKSPTQQQNYRANVIGQFCYQNQPSICLYSKVQQQIFAKKIRRSDDTQDNSSQLWSMLVWIELQLFFLWLLLDQSCCGTS